MLQRGQATRAWGPSVLAPRARANELVNCSCENRVQVPQVMLELLQATGAIHCHFYGERNLETETCEKKRSLAHLP